MGLSLERKERILNQLYAEFAHVLGPNSYVRSRLEVLFIQKEADLLSSGWIK